MSNTRDDGMTDYTGAVLAQRCPVCKAAPGQRCTTRMDRGYHLARADKAVRALKRAQAEHHLDPEVGR